MAEQPQKTKKSRKTRPKIQPISAEKSQTDDDEGLGFGDILTGPSSPKDASPKNATSEEPQHKAGATATPEQAQAQSQAPPEPVADLTPKPLRASWWSLSGCCRPPPGPSASQLQKRIDELARLNRELEASVASLSEEKTALESRLAKEKKKKTDAKERRTTFKKKLANMSERLKEDFGEDFDGLESPRAEEKDADTSFTSR